VVARLCAENARLLWSLAAAHASPSAADDVVQEAALTALRRLDTFRQGTNFRAWMAEIVRRTARNSARDSHAARNRRDEPIDGAEPAVCQDHDGVSLDDRVLSALRALPEAARACFVLRVVHELSPAEIGGLLEMPEATVCSHVHRARAALRERLGAPRTPEPAPAPSLTSRLP
jgi:RNA polymerase sigma-70 factor (ECF subfamily)